MFQHEATLRTLSIIGQEKASQAMNYTCFFFNLKALYFSSVFITTDPAVSSAAFVL